MPPDVMETAIYIKLYRTTIAKRIMNYYTNLRRVFSTFPADIRAFEQAHGFFAVGLALLAFLLFQNPFAPGSYIANLYPHPDSIHYINPPLSLLAGKGFKITRMGTGIAPDVPPLYSLVLLPFFAIYRDPRMFYFANVLLSFTSLVLFYLILLKLFGNRWNRVFLLLIYVTNLILHMYPLLAMAENLILPLFLTAIYLLIVKTTLKKSLLAGVIAISFYATKYASFPLTLSFFLLYIGKILLEKLNRKEKLRTLSAFCLAFLVGYIPLDLYEHVFKHSTLFSKISDYLTALISDGRRGFAADSATKYFTLSYLRGNLLRYIRVLLGKSSTIILGHTFPTVLGFIAIYAWVGFVGALFNARFRYLIFSLVFMLVASIVFISTFIEFDLRYVYHLIPTLILGFGIFLDLANKLCKRFLVEKYFYLGLVGLLVIYLAQAQVLLAYRGAEPLDYAAIMVVNEYFGKPLANDSKPAKVITAIPPYIVDFYSNGNYELFPLSPNQHFFDKAELVWGPNDYSDLTVLYKSYLVQGYDVYIQRSTLINYELFNRGYMQIIKNFRPAKVDEGCKTRCNLYKLSLR